MASSQVSTWMGITRHLKYTVRYLSKKRVVEEKLNFSLFLAEQGHLFLNFT